MIPIQEAPNGVKSSAAESISTVKSVSPEEQAIVTNEKYSVRQFSPNSWGGFVGDAFGFLLPVTRDLIGPYGTFECDLALRTLAYAQHGGLWGGATKIWTQKALGTPYEISGGRNQTYKWQDIFAESDFGEGYDFMMDKAYQDLLTLNRGMFLEKVSYGESDTPIRDGAQILALNHLDAMRIYFTGNREYPYLYSSEWNGQLHKMHYTRVIHIALSPSPNTRLFGIGRSALYDALTVANSQLLLGRHQNELLSDLPPTGIVLFTNVKAEDVKVAMEQFDLERRRDGQNVYRAPLQLNSKDPAHPATVQFIPMATVPEGFDYEKYMATHVNLVALALQLDPQDIWPLASLSLGTGQQSKILEMKSESKGPGYILTLMEREFNKVLPRSLEWKFKAQNTAQDTQIANTAKVWTDIANTSSFMTQDEKRQLVADQVPAFADVLMDENGVVRLFDADPKEMNQIITADDNAQLDTANGAQDATANSENETLMIDAKEPSALTVATPKQPAAMPTSAPSTMAKPSQPSSAIKPNPAADSALNNKFKDVNDQVKAGFLTLADAQAALGIKADPVYEGMYLVEGFPVPKEKIRDLWQAHFGRGVASFDAVVSGETLPAGTGAGPTPDYASKDIDPNPEVIIRKNIDATGDAYIEEIAALMQDAVSGSITKSAFASRFRGAITRYGKKAYQDGLEDGGVDPDELDEDDLRIIADDNVRDSQYVSNLASEIYSEAGLSGTVEYRASLWISTINHFYYDGIASADKNGMYEFVGDDGVENCDTCKALKGQVHRMKEWVKRELRPGVDHKNFDCGTWEPNCSHYLEKTTGKSKGSWL